jgi:hypothetical protein
MRMSLSHPCLQTKRTLIRAPLTDLLRSATALPAARAGAQVSVRRRDLPPQHPRLIVCAARPPPRRPHGVRRGSVAQHLLLQRPPLCLRVPGKPRRRLRAVRGHPAPDQCSYNAVVAALARKGHGGDALLFERHVRQVRAAGGGAQGVRGNA